jgi:putative ABC transport system substrate-binding protein
MKRRAFITLFGGAAAAAWPLAARAQQPGRMPLIAVLTGVSDDQTARTRSTAFVTRLQELGWTDGRNMRLELRWGRGDAEIIRRQATELVALAPDVIVTTGGPATERMLQLTRSVPIVFAVVPDPVGSGLVARLSRPGGNATGFMQFEYSLSGKWLELLKQIAPSMTRTAVLRDAAITAGIGQFAVIQSVAPSVGVEVVPINLTDGPEMERAVLEFSREAGGGLLVTASAIGLAHRETHCRACDPAQTASGLCRPRLYLEWRPDLLCGRFYRPVSARRRLRRSRPQGRKAGHKTAKALAIEVPAQLLARADEVIE